MSSLRLNPILVEKLSAEAARRNISVDQMITNWMNSVIDTREMHQLTPPVPDMIARFDLQMRFTYVNEAITTLLGHPENEIIGQTIYALDVPEDFADYLTAQLRQPTATKHEHRAEYSLTTKERSATYELQTIPVFDAENTVESIIMVVRDITQRLKTEAALKDSERRYRSIVEGQIDLVCLYHPDTTVAYVNDAYCAYYGKSREQIVGQSFLNQTESMDHPRILARVQEILHDPTPKSAEYHTSCPDGLTHNWLSWIDHGIVDDTGVVYMIQAIGRNISHIKRIEHQLEVEHARYEQLFNETPLPLMVYDLHTLEYMAVNDAAVQAYGYSRAEFLTMTIAFIRPDDELPRMRAFLNEHRNAILETLVMGIWQHRRKDGTLFDVEVTGRDIVFHGRNARMIMAVDLTERRALEAERMYAQSLEIELKKEREITLLKERFMSMVTHEFRTPLSIIVSTVEILKNYLHRLSKDNIVHKLDIVTNEANRMSSLLNDVLTLTRATTGRMNVTPEPIELVEIISSLVDNLRLADRDQHLFSLHFDSSKIHITTDRRLTEQILINLLGNAVKYSPQGSVITLAAEHQAQHVTIRITDKGRGIPKSDQARIFEAFHRADNAGGVEGTGLGLTIVKESITALGGEISFQSDVGVGTTFVVSLPIKVAATV